MVADFLQLETSLRRRFREESISDLIVASLLRISGPGLIVQVPQNELVTGNDFDIVIFDSVQRAAIQYRIQAKRLTPHPTNWEIGSYVHLAHPGNTGTQSAALVRSAAATKSIPTIPLYAFYNPSGTCAASGGVVNGIELADGRAIRAIVKQLVNAKPMRPPLKRIGRLQPLFFPLSTILCPPANEPDRTIPSPESSRRAVVNAMSAGAERFFRWPFDMPPKALANLRSSPGISSERSLVLSDRLPSFLAQAMEMRSAVPGVAKADVDRPRIVLFSEAT